MNDAVEIFNNESYVEPLVHIGESDAQIVVMIDLPCVRKEDIDLKVSEKAVEIKTIIKTTIKNKRGVKFCLFHKIIDLPAKIVREKVKAKFEKGILLITLPKERTSKRIKIE
ncbi:MAG: hypothetical protein CVT88_01335 [Candidatus Altiarchaeales archaeon HGW-Altiarchaeales-1]|nr:MAG: hypothetical protein CVT88_01335 [Candidatus Altiarchaeales archaeon HGW-Altiarchaeales-1]